MKDLEMTPTAVDLWVVRRKIQRAHGSDHAQGKCPCVGCRALRDLQKFHHANQAPPSPVVPTLVLTYHTNVGQYTVLGFTGEGHLFSEGEVVSETRLNSMMRTRECRIVLQPAH